MRLNRDPIFWMASLLYAVVGSLALSAALGASGQVFPGFLVLESRVVATTGLTSWPAVQEGEIVGQELLEIDGLAIANASRLIHSIRTLDEGTALRWRVRSADGETREIIVKTRRMSGIDLSLIYGPLLFCGFAVGAIALLIRFFRPSDPAATGSATGLFVIAMWALSSTGLYGPHHLTQSQAAAEALLAPAVFHLGLVFPYPGTLIRRVRWLVPAAWAAGAVLALGFVIHGGEPSGYRLLHGLAMLGLGLATAVFVAAQLRAFARPKSEKIRQRIKVFLIGSLVALAPQSVLVLSSDVLRPETIAYGAVFSPLALGYAILRRDLMGVDLLFRRAVSYGVLTGFVALLYGAGIAAAESALSIRELDRGTSVALMAFLSIVVVLPLRDRIQEIVDRVFFRTAYDFQRIIERTASRLARASGLPVVVQEITSTIDAALQPTWISLEVQGETSPSKQVQAPAALEVALQSGDETIAWLRVGAALSARPYSSTDQQLVDVIASQATVAIERGLATRRLQDLNHTLEQRVHDRTAELENALRELQQTQSHLIQQEKMASLGEVVAGVAHELNNPLSFVSGNVQMLRESVAEQEAFARACEVALRSAGPDGELALRRLRSEHRTTELTDDLSSMIDGCEEGASRATEIVRDLRSFARRDATEFSEANLTEQLEMALTLLSTRLDSVETVRDYEALPQVLCLVGQMGQVFLNLIGNAIDAMPDGGVLTLRTRHDDAWIRVEIADSGDGIDPDVIERIFDPFFTTKEIGKGTGLGLSISYGVIERHGGRLEVTSDPGMGCCFRVLLPIGGRDQGAEATGDC